MSTVGQTIWNQISIGVKMATAAREPVAFENGLHFRVTIRPRIFTKIRIVLTPLDLYDIELLQLAEHATRQTTLAAQEMVQAEDLSRAIHAMCMDA